MFINKELLYILFMKASNASVRMRKNFSSTFAKCLNMIPKILPMTKIASKKEKKKKVAWITLK